MLLLMLAGIVWMGLCIVCFREDRGILLGIVGSAAFLLGAVGLVIEHVSINVH
jgi:hypothetical protein